MKDRYGTPLAPLFADDIRNANAPPSDPFDRCCVHTDEPFFGARCGQPGTHWLRRDLLDRDMNGDLRWPQQRWMRFCPQHAKPGFHVPIPEAP